MKKNIILTEYGLGRLLKKIINEQYIRKKGTNVDINGQEYKLQVKKFGGWKDVDIDELRPRTDGGYDIKASLGIFSQKDVVPADTINLIKNNFGKDEILLGGKTEKKLVKLK